MSTLKDYFGISVCKVKSWKAERGELSVFREEVRGRGWKRGRKRMKERDEEDGREG